MIYITGDTHAQFHRIKQFLDTEVVSAETIMIILGDSGFNYYVEHGKDMKLNVQTIKKPLSEWPVTFFCIHGNHEERPYNVEGYELTEFFGAPAYVNSKYPNQIFAKDGEIYDIAGYKVLVIGGAYSVDKYYRLSGHGKWFESEQPDDLIKAYTEANLEKANWKVDIVLSHTCPVKIEPRHLFLPFIDQSTVDKSTEEWLQTLADRLDFKKWYFGHFHDDWKNGKYRMLFEKIEPFKL